MTQPFWSRRFAADPAIVGQTVRLDGEPYAVVGVIEAGFATPVRDVDFVVPFQPERDPRRGERNSLNFVHAVGRLARGASPAQGAAELTAIARTLQAQYPVANARKCGVRFVPVIDGVAGSFRTALLTLFAAVAAMLLVACANLANLMLTRAAGIQKELAVRLALGASRRAIVRQVLVESLIVAATGGVAGTVLAHWAVTGLVAVAPADLPRAGDIRVDGAVLTFSLALTTLTGVLFGIVPAFVSARVGVREALQADGRGTTGRGRGVRSALVAVEVMFAVALLVIVTMLGKSFVNVQRVAPGFEPARALSARVTLPASRYDTRTAIVTFQRSLGDRLTALPGVRQAGAISILPLTGLLARVPFTVDGRPIDRERVPLAQFRIVSPGYFGAAGIPVTRGRLPADGDSDATRPVAVVNEQLARDWLRGAEPIGSRLLLDDNNTGPRPIEIVGIVGDVQQLALDGAPTWDVYLPYAQMHRDTVGLAAASMFWIVRSLGDPAALAGSFTREVRRADPQVAASQVQPMDRYLSDALAPRRFSLSLFAAFAGAALALAVVGIYAVIAYAVSQRGRELGIRLALGASEGRIVWLIVRDGMRFVLAGAAGGALCAAGAARAIATMLFGVSIGDLRSFTDVIFVMTVVSLVACAAPAAGSRRFLRLLAAG